MIEDVQMKPDLFAQGTRWEHYNELRELFLEGADILSRVRIKTPFDRLRMGKLINAAEMIEARLNFITDFNKNTAYGSKLRTAIDNEVGPMVRKLKIEKGEADATTQSKKDEEDHNDDSPADYTTK